MIKADIQLKQDIEDELGSDPKVDAAQIGVSVNEGAVSLLGAVDSYTAKWATEEAVKRVRGGRAVAQDLTVRLSAKHHRSDLEIAGAVKDALDSNVFIPTGVTASVQEGQVTLEGQVKWNAERVTAERAVRPLPGVTDVINCIGLTPRPTATQVKEEVEAALKRQATVDSLSIQVNAADGEVTLSGRASSWRAVEDARRAAWATPGVTAVVDQVRVAPPP